MKPTQIVNPFVKLYEPQTHQRPDGGYEVRVDRRVQFWKRKYWVDEGYTYQLMSSTNQVLYYHNIEGPAVPQDNGREWWIIGGTVVGRGRTMPIHFQELAALWKQTFPNSPPEPFDHRKWVAKAEEYLISHGVIRAVY